MILLITPSASGAHCAESLHAATIAVSRMRTRAQFKLGMTTGDSIRDIVHEHPRAGKIEVEVGADQSLRV